MADDITRAQATPTPDRALRLLALGPQDVCPPVDGGKEGIHGALAALARRAHVVYAYPRSARADPLAGYHEIGVTALPIDHVPSERPADIAAATLALRPYKFEKYGSQAAVRALDRVLPPNRVDAIVCFHAHTVHLAERLRKARGWHVPIILREHNIEYEVVASYRRSLGLAKQLVVAPFEWLTRREERSIWRRVDAAAFLSDHDLATATATGVRGHFILAREGVPLPPRRPVRPPAVGAPLLVLLNPRAAQSVANLREFLHRYWLPLRATSAVVQARELHVTGLDLAGLAALVDIPTATLQSAGVRGLGFLATLAQTLEGALALVSPTFVGGGIRKKVLEAMAHQLPVIATALDMTACTYFEADRNVLSMADPDDFAASITRLGEDPAFWCEVSAASRATVEEFASWDGFADVILAAVERLVALPSAAC